MTAAEEVPAAIVGDAVAGDVAALERIIVRYHDDMARVCMIVCGDADLAQDAVQASWPIVWRKLGSVRDRDRLRHWLVAVAANEARQMMRRRRRFAVVELDIADVGTSRDDPALTVDVADLRTALRRLGPDDRALLALRYVAGLEFSDIGAAIGLTASGARSRMERLLARLRTELDHD